MTTATLDEKREAAPTLGIKGRIKGPRGCFITREQALALAQKPVPPIRPIVREPSSVTWHEYDVPPKPMLPADERGRMPDGPGVYFVWRDDEIVYVGKSVRLSRRCGSASHCKINDGDWLSWIDLPSDQLYFAESFYIGALRPRRNAASGMVR